MSGYDDLGHDDCWGENERFSAPTDEEHVHRYKWVGGRGTCDCGAGASDTYGAALWYSDTENQ